jgi:hypothetical protein
LEQLAEDRGEDADEEGYAGGLNRHESTLEVQVSDKGCLVSHHAGMVVEGDSRGAGSWPAIST